MGARMMANRILHSILLNCSLDEQNILAFQSRVAAIHHQLPSYEATGWIDYPLHDHEQLMMSITDLATEIKTKADVLVVIGVGGSFLGARAIQEALTPYFGIHQNGIEVV